jgi:beta-glucuronidase
MGDQELSPKVSTLFKRANVLNELLRKKVRVTNLARMVAQGEMKLILLFILLFAVIPIARAQQIDLITNTDNRKTISLDGQWRVIIDPYESGYYDYRYQPSANGYFKDAKPKTKSDLIEYDFDNSGLLRVPGDWNSQDERLLFYEGTIWYKKSFDYQSKPNTRLFVYFGAANYLADVYLNGQKLGRHEGGFTPFDFEITHLVRETNNSLIVKVDNQRRRDAVPTLITDWWNYGGLTRQVKLIETPSTFVQDYFIQLEKGSRNQVSGWVKLNGDRLSQRIKIEIPEARAGKSFTTNGSGYAQINFDANLSLWSPDKPKLYDVIIETDTDRLHDEIGFRSIETRGTDILLNGRPIFLRGVCIHEEAPFRDGRAYSREDALTLLGWAKELGANFVRLAHYPHNEAMIREADRMGIMVWSEIPVYWTILWENSATLQNAQNQLSEMIARDKNRAAIIIWSMANETPVGDARLSFLRKLIEHARSLDSTRLISAAMERHYLDGTTTQMIDDPLGEYVDVFGCNEYVGWYDGLPEKIDRIEWKMKYQKPLIMTEFGAEAPYGNHGDPLTRWTEEYQENVYQRQVKMLKRIPFLRGTCPWILMDFRSPRRPLPGIQDFYNRKGLISDHGERKKAFYVMQSFYQGLEKDSRQ